MLDSNLSGTQFFLISVIPALFAIVLHEVSHSWALYKLGARTAMMLGRLSLNLIKHYKNMDLNRPSIIFIT